MVKNLISIAVLVLALPMCAIGYFGRMPIFLAGLKSLGDTCVHDLCFSPNFIDGPVKFGEDCIFYFSRGAIRCVTADERFTDKIARGATYVKDIRYGEVNFRVYKAVDAPSLKTPQVVHLIPDGSMSTILTSSDRLQDPDIVRILSSLHIKGS